MTDKAKVFKIGTQSLGFKKGQQQAVNLEEVFLKPYGIDPQKVA